MDDLTSKLNSFLSSEDGMQKLQQLASALSSSEGQGSPGEGQPQGSASSGTGTQQSSGSMPDLSGLVSMLSNSGLNLGSSSPSPQNGGEQNSGDSANPLAGLDIGMIMKIQQALSSYGKDDKNTMLLKSLKPHLREERQGKVDEALKLMKLASLLPMFVQGGFFGSGGER